MSTPESRSDVPASVHETIVFGEAAKHGDLYASPAHPVRFDLQLQTAKATGIRYTNVPHTVRQYGEGAYGWGMAPQQRLYELALNYLALLLPVEICGEEQQSCSIGTVSKEAWDRHIAFAAAFLSTDRPALTILYSTVVTWLEGQGTSPAVVRTLQQYARLIQPEQVALDQSSLVLIPLDRYGP